jgi:RecB family exonuclease
MDDSLEGYPNVDDLIITYTEKWQKSFDPKMNIVSPGMTHKDYYNKGVHFLIDYYFSNQPFKDNTIEVEKKIIIDLNEKTKIIGFIDRLVHDIENDTFEIHDYKTSNSQPRSDHGEKDRQLALYSIAIKESFGKDKQVKLIWHFLAHNQKIKSYRTNEQLEKLKKETMDLIRNIENTTVFPPTKSRLCDWCEYRDICPAWKNN